MCVRIGRELSEPRAINGGSSQGSFLGNYLFCITTDWLGKINEVPPPTPATVTTPAALRRNRARLSNGDAPVRRSTMSGSAPPTVPHPPQPEEETRQFAVGLEGDEVFDEQHRGGLDVEDSDWEYDFRYFRFKSRHIFDSSDEEEMEVLDQEGIDHLLGQPDGWEEKEIRKCIYIDDYNVIEKVRQRDAIFNLTTAGRVSYAHAPKSQNFFNSLKTDAHAIGMKINDSQTQIICISPSINCCRSYITTSDGVRIESSDKLNLLGFVFSPSPTPHAQLANILARFRKRLWSLRYVKKSGLVAKDLCLAYTTYLRPIPILEYGTIAIHSMLSQEQSDMNETQQSRALKIIYGDISSGQALVKSGLELLSDRREKAVDRFAAKLIVDPRFSHMFPLRPEEQRRARSSHKYLELQSKTNRLYNSPFYYMRRRLNAIKPVTQVQRSDTSQRCDFIHDEWR